MEYPAVGSPRSLYSRFCRSIFRLIGWRLSGSRPAHPKYVMVGAPHTSNLDFIIFLLIIGAFDIPARWIGKDTLFRGPAGWLLTRLGGIPVNRRSSNGFVQQMVDSFAAQPELVIAIAPEGTRARATAWKTGFYYIATGAEVPIALCFLDASRREAGIGPVIPPCGNIQDDFELIRQFYQDKIGFKPAYQSQIELRPAT